MRIRLALAALALVAGTAVAQQNPAQDNFHTFQPTPAADSSLAGVRSVYLTPVGNRLDSTTFQDFALRLREAGIRIASSSEPADAQLFLSVSKLRCGLGGCDGLFAIELDQQTEVVRLGNTVQTTTWLSEALGLGVGWDSWLRATAKQETDTFISHWRAANGG
jgi:hypothetical protein